MRSVGYAGLCGDVPNVWGGPDLEWVLLIKGRIPVRLESELETVSSI